MSDHPVPSGRNTLANALRSHLRLALALDLSDEPLIIVDALQRVSEINPAAQKFFAVAGRIMVGERLPASLGNEIGLSEGLLPQLAERCVERRIRIHHPAYTVAASDLTGNSSIAIIIEPLLELSGTLLGAAIFIRTVNEIAPLRRDAVHDPLTGLPNRAEFVRQIREALSECQRLGKQHVLCHLDLDHFKLINEAVGPLAGDAYLKDLTALLKQTIRRSDSLCRVGGDEFAIIFRGCSREQGLALAKGVLKAVEEFRWEIQGRVHNVGASIGAVTIDEASPNVNDLIARAASARQIAKEEGRHRIYYSDSIDPQITQRHERMRTANDLRSAMDQDRFCLQAEPICATSDLSRVAYHELLIRMLDAYRGLLRPGEFIPAAEDFMLMPQLDHWVLRHAFQRLPFFSGRVAINLSGQSLNQPELADTIEQLLTEYGVDPTKIIFELTETATVRHLDMAERLMKRLQGQGIEFALDDFGSGMSSFAYLRRLPVQWLKIDGLFLSAPVLDHRDQALIHAMATMAHELGVRCIAEHVEDLKQVELLRTLGVDFVQGYAVGKAAPWL